MLKWKTIQPGYNGGHGNEASYLSSRASTPIKLITEAFIQRKDLTPFFLFF